MTTYKETLCSPSSSSPLALESPSLSEVSEQDELQNFTLKMNSATNPETEAKRLEFWILSVRKFGEQLRCLSLYEEKNTSFHPQQNSFFQSAWYVQTTTCPRKGRHPSILHYVLSLKIKIFRNRKSY